MSELDYGKVARLLEDKNKVKLDSRDFFDRVINIKLITAEEEYVIRSDYEVVYNNLDVTRVFRTGNIANENYHIRKCTFKPDIKVQYQRATSEVGIEMDIYITNFYMFDKSGKALMSFNSITNPLQTVEVEMGYFSQFEKLPHETFEDLQEMHQGYGIDKIVSDVQYVTTDKLPPDSVLHIHSWVGSVIDSEVAGLIARDFASIEKSPLVSTVKDDKNKITATNASTSVDKTFLEEMFFTHITKRFVKHKKDVKNTHPKDGVLPDNEATEYGIQIFCSPGVKELSKSVAVPKKDSEDKPISFDVFYGAGSTARRVFNNINETFGKILIRQELNDGNWVVFTNKEELDVKKLREDFKAQLGSEGAFYYRNRLPAVYNITVAATTSIVAPFFFFINPFETIYFKSRYRTSQLVTYYINEQGEGEFMAFRQQISFATVENINEMTLVCTNRG